MKQMWSSAWIASKQPRKQRKYRYNAPVHIRTAFLHVHLSKVLREKYHCRALRVRVGDTVKILRGSFKGKEGKVNRADARRSKVYVDDIDRIKKDGSKVFIALQPSNLLLINVVTTDKRRFQTMKVGTYEKSS